MLYSCTHMATVGAKGLKVATETSGNFKLNFYSVRTTGCGNLTTSTYVIFLGYLVICM